MTLSERRNDTAALIIGFTIQGLALARAFRAQSIKVYVVVQEKQGQLMKRRDPASRTGLAKIFSAKNLLDHGLVEALIDCRKNIPEAHVAVFAASDNTVSALGRYWEELEQLYLLSWADCRKDILNIIHKRNLPAYCDQAGISYPRTHVVSCLDDSAEVASMLMYPVLVKPDKPASSFKTHIVGSADELKEFVRTEKGNLPLVVQEWIEGADSCLYFYSCFLDKGRIVLGMTGRKIRASPPGIGRATIIESFEDDGVQAAAMKLIELWGISGPAALEFKKGLNGTYWFIEANVGRTEYCIDLLIQCGLNVPYFDFLLALDEELPNAPAELEQRVWFDTEKEPFSYLFLCLKQKTFKPFGKSPVFPYVGHGEPLLVCHAFLSIIRDLVGRCSRKVAELLRVRSGSWGVN